MIFTAYCEKVKMKIKVKMIKNKALNRFIFIKVQHYSSWVHVLQKDGDSNLIMVDKIHTCTHICTHIHMPMLECMCAGPQLDYTSIHLLAFDGATLGMGFTSPPFCFLQGSCSYLKSDEMKPI